MQLPIAARADVDPAKVRDYLLSPEHPVGRFKAAVFVRLGCDQTTAARLREDLQAIAQTGDADAGTPLPYGQPHRIHAILRGPNGKSLSLVTIWIVRTGEDFPRLVTAHPGAAP